MRGRSRGYGLAIVIMFFIGGLIGTILSLLLAPQSGKRTRKQIRRVSIDAQDGIADAAQKAKETMNELVDQCIERFNAALEDNSLIPRR